MSDASKDRELARVWNSWNAAFRRGYTTFLDGKPNPGDEKIGGTPRALHDGWCCARDGRPMPDDPMFAAIGADNLTDEQWKSLEDTQ
jgi:hypothetical protein